MFPVQSGDALHYQFWREVPENHGEHWISFGHHQRYVWRFGWPHKKPHLEEKHHCNFCSRKSLTVEQI